jgi:hypothetical protein
LGYRLLIGLSAIDWLSAIDLVIGLSGYWVIGLGNWCDHKPTKNVIPNYSPRFATRTGAMTSPFIMTTSLMKGVAPSICPGGGGPE